LVVLKLRCGRSASLSVGPHTGVAAVATVAVADADAGRTAASAAAAALAQCTGHSPSNAYEFMAHSEQDSHMKGTGSNPDSFDQFGDKLRASARLTGRRYFFA
jgi:hypothetical protein